MSDTLKVSQSTTVVGLGTWTHTALQNSMYFVSAQASEVPPSGLSVVINKNGSPVASSTAPAAAQNHLEIQKLINCAANDVITVVISSSSAIDQQLNTVKTIIDIRIGQ